VIRILYATIDQEPLSEARFHQYLSRLPDDLRTSVLRYHNWTDQHLVLFGKLLLLKGLERFGIVNPSLGLLKYSDYKRPYFDDTIDFNISHSGRYVLCAISDEYRIGIDVEEIRPIDLQDFKDLWTHAEWRAIQEADDQHLEFYRYWTRKEAVIKADGKGMYIPLKEIDVTGDRVTVGANTWFLQEVQLSSSNRVHVATSGVVSDALLLERFTFYP